MQSEPNTHNFQTNCSINSRTIVILGVCLWALLLYCSNERHEYEVFRINSSIRLKWSNFSKSIRKSFSKNCIAFLSRLHKPCNISFFSLSRSLFLHSQLATPCMQRYLPRFFLFASMIFHGFFRLFPLWIYLFSFSFPSRNIAYLLNRWLEFWHLLLPKMKSYYLLGFLFYSLFRSKWNKKKTD